MVLFIIDCEVVHAWRVCVLWRWLKTWKLERWNRVLKRTPGNTPRANARPTQDGRRGLQRQRERDGGCRANWFRRKTRGVFIIYSKAIFRKISQGLTCVLVLYCFTSIDIIADSRLGKNEKYVIMTLDPNHTQTLIGMYAFQLYGWPVSLDAVACEGSRLIRPIRLLCLERL